MTILIVEDEFPAIQKLERYLEEYHQPIQVIGKLKSVSETKTWLTQNNHPDLILSDIELQDGNVLFCYQSIPINCPIIFTTAYNQFLLDAFKTNGIEYLLKPFTFIDLTKALDKFINLNQSFFNHYKKLLNQIHPNYDIEKEAFKTRFVVKKNKDIFILKTEDVSYITLENGVIKAFNHENQKFYLEEKSLSSLVIKLDPSHFFKINRNQIIHINQILKMESYGVDRLAIHLKNVDTPLITSQNKTPLFKKWLNK